MIPRYSFTLLGRNFDLVFKVLIYVFVLMLICVALLVSIINPILEAFNSNFKVLDRLMLSMSDVFNERNSNAMGDFVTDISLAFDGISSQIPIAILLIILVIFITKFFFSLTTVPLGEVIYGRMSKNYSVMFHNVLIASLGKALLFSLIHTAVTVAADAVIAFVCFYLGKLLYAAIGPLAVAVMIFVFFGLVAARMAFLGQWVPQIVCEKKNVAKAFRDSFRYSAKYFWKVMPVNFVAIIIAFSTGMSTMVLTFGLLPALMMPFMLVLMSNLNFVAYFTFNKKKFYIDEATVVNQIEDEIQD